MFIGAQGCDIKQNMLFRDNQSAINMDKNGRKLCTGNSRHTHISYFFAKDRVEREKNVNCILQHRTNYRRLFYKTPTRGPICEIS